MIKLADDVPGSISSRGVDKNLTGQDCQRLDEGVLICEEIRRQFGAGDEELFYCATLKSPSH